MPPIVHREYIYENLRARMRRDDEVGLLHRFLTWPGEELDRIEATHAAIAETLSWETTTEPFIEWWLWSLFGWSWFPAWWTIERKREFYSHVASHYAKRGTPDGIIEFLRDFGVSAQVFRGPEYWGEFYWSGDTWTIDGPLGMVVQILPVAAAQPGEYAFWGEFFWDLAYWAVPSDVVTITRADLERLLQFQQPLSQLMMLEDRLDHTAAPTVASFTSTASASDFQLYDFDATASQGEHLTFVWDFGDGSQPAQGVEVSHYFNQVGNYEVSLKVTNIRGTSHTLTQEVFSGLPVGSGLMLWLDASKITGLTDAAVVAQWNDESGNANHATQTDNAKRPTYRTNVIGSRPTVRFDDVDDGMITANSDFTATPYSVFIVYNYRSAIGGPHRALQGTGNWLIGPYQGLHTLFDGIFFTNRPAVVQNIFVIVAAICGTVNSSHYVDGVLRETRATGPNALTKICLGASGGVGETLDGDIAEVIAYNRELSTAERQAVENYLSQKYGITI